VAAVHDWIVDTDFPAGGRTGNCGREFRKHVCTGCQQYNLPEFWEWTGRMD
jgi:hypothetical protein